MTNVAIIVSWSSLTFRQSLYQTKGGSWKEKLGVWERRRETEIEEYTWNICNYVEMENWMLEHKEITMWNGVMVIKFDFTVNVIVDFIVKNNC